MRVDDDVSADPEQEEDHGHRRDRFRRRHLDLISVQYHSLKAGHDYGQYVRDADNAGRSDIADFFRSVMKQDAERAAQCHTYLKQLETSGQSA